MKTDLKNKNKCIADFIGRNNTKYLNYHEDWSELMEVIDKLESIGLSSRIHYDTISDEYFCDFVDIDNNEMGSALGSCKIEVVYEAVWQSIWNINPQS